MRTSSLVLLSCLLAVRAADVPAAAEPLAPAPEASAAVSAAYAPPFATPTALTGRPAQALPPTLFNRLSKIAKLTLLGGKADTADRELKDRADGLERVTDTNWSEVVEGGDPSDAWLLVVDGQDPLSPLYVEGHLNASRLAKQALQTASHTTKLDEEIERLKRLHWARVDYATEPELCTRWYIWRPPYFVFATDNGKTLRFLSPSQVRPDGENLFKIMRTGQWEQIPVWDSRYAPGGDRAWVAEYYIVVSNFVSSKTSGIPNFMWMLLSGALTQFMLQYFHTPKKETKPASVPGVGAGPGARRKVDTTKLLERARLQMIEKAEKEKADKKHREASKGKASGAKAGAGSTPVSRKKRAD